MMPSTIAWFALAMVAGAVVGLALGHWSTVMAWVERRLADPAVPPADRRDAARSRDKLKTS